MIAFRYVLRELLVRAAFCLAAGLVLYLVVDVVESGKALARLGVGAREAAWMSLLAAPRAAMQLLPAAALLAAFLTAGALRRRGEIEGLRVLGRGPAVLMAPFLAGGALCGGLALVLGETVVPTAVTALDDARARAGWFGPVDPDAATLVRDLEGTIWRVRGRSADGATLLGATGFHAGAGDVAGWRADLEELRWDGAVWRHARGVRRAIRAGSAGGDEEPRRLGPGTIALVSPRAMDPPPREGDALAAPALARRLAALAAQGRPSARLAVELWGRGGLFLVALAGVLAAVPFGLGPRRLFARRGRGANRASGARIAAREALGAAVGTALVLWALVATGRALGSAGLLSAPLATLVPPAIAIAAVALLVRRAIRGST